MYADDVAGEPYVPTATDHWDLMRVAHLRRRAGFGATCTELRRDAVGGPDRAIGRLLDSWRSRRDE